MFENPSPFVKLYMILIRVEIWLYRILCKKYLFSSSLQVFTVFGYLQCYVKKKRGVYSKRYKVLKIIVRVGTTRPVLLYFLLLSFGAEDL